METSSFSPSMIIAGCMRWGHWGVRMDPDRLRSMIQDCLASGIDTFDHADIYGGPHATESDFGRVLGADPALRSRMKIITKCGILLPDKPSSAPRIKHYDTSARYILASAEQSLSSLKTDHIDLFLIHRPDPLMQPDEMAEAFFRLKRDGKVLHFGVSNFKASQLRMIYRHWPVEVNQLQVSVEHPHALFDGSVDACMELGVRVQAWSPLGAGAMDGAAEDERLRKIHAVAEIIAQRHGLEASQVLLAWVLTHPAKITPVLGTSRIDRMRTAVAVAMQRLDREEWFMLLRASTGRDVA
ncbi:MAG: aldo/keto reductase [Chitinophagaceae bacterium]